MVVISLLKSVIPKYAAMYMLRGRQSSLDNAKPNPH